MTVSRKLTLLAVAQWSASGSEAANEITGTERSAWSHRRKQSSAVLLRRSAWPASPPYHAALRRRRI